MLVRPRWFSRFVVLSLSLMFIPTAAAQVKTAPVVPGYVRFHQDGKGDLTKGGQLLLGELSCINCHAPGAEFEPILSRKVGPILDGVGSRVKRSHLREFLSDPHKTKPGTTMPDLFAGVEENQKKDDVEALVHFLASTGAVAAVRPDRKGIPSGQDLYDKVGCVTCHGTRDGKGDQLKLFAGSVPLGNLKAKYTLASLKSFLENPHQTRPSGRMPKLLTAKEASDVAKFLMQGTGGPLSMTNMKYAYYEGAWQNLPDFTKLKPVASGDASDFELSVARRLNDCALKFDGFLKIEKEGNYSFHLNSDDGSKLWIDDKLIVNNDGIHPPQSKSGKAKLKAGMHKLTLAVFNGGGGFELNAEIEGAGLGRQPLGPLVYPEAEVKPPPIAKDDPDNFPLQPALIAKGKALFSAKGCVNCHQLKDETKKVAPIALAQMKNEGGCLDAKPRKDVPWYGLNDAQRKSLASAIKAPAPQKVALVEKINRTMSAFNCYACHERDKVGGAEDDLNKYFQTVMPEMGDEGRLPPSLTAVGAKLKTAYFKKILDQGAHDRPYMHTRMPGFGDANVGHLVTEMQKIDPVEVAPKVALSEPLNKAKFAARHMVGPQAFGCTKCHTFAGNKAEGVQGMDLAIMTQRLNRDWFFNYMLDPSRFRPGTRMPASFPDGKTLLKNVLDGKADTQIEAIWIYLSDGTAATLPIGIATKGKGPPPIVLIPGTEAIVYRNFIQGAGARAIGVGFPERAHLAFDANEMRLAMIWQGAFMDAARHWTDRGVGFQPPLGDNVVHLPAGVNFFILGQPAEAWPAKTPAKSLGYKFNGYRLTDDQRPTFLYSFNEIKIEDFPNAIDTKGSPGIRRSFTLTTDNPIDKLYYRAAVGDRIDAEKDGWYRIGDMRMRIEADAAPIIRQSAGKMELLVPIRFKGNSAKVVQEYVW